MHLSSYLYLLCINISIIIYFVYFYLSDIPQWVIVHVLYIYTVYVTLDHKTSHKGQFYEMYKDFIIFIIAILSSDTSDDILWKLNE